jgi:cephalosporin hydroxylase
MPSSLPEVNEIATRAADMPNDISDHLVTIFSEAVARQPRLIVELGVRGGESRFVLERVARVTGAALVSVDMDNCSSVCGQSPLWHFVQSDDVQFAEIFKRWCRQHLIKPEIDVLFIDTSHLYEHTLQEIRAWFPYLSERGKAVFHDSNARGLYRRQDGTIGFSLYAFSKMKRGVIRAIEEYLGTTFNERIDFVTVTQGWLIRHWAYCNGLTVMERSSLAQTMDERPGTDESSSFAATPVSSIE